VQLPDTVAQSAALAGESLALAFHRAGLGRQSPIPAVHCPTLADRCGLSKVPRPGVKPRWPWVGGHDHGLIGQCLSLQAHVVSVTGRDAGGKGHGAHSAGECAVLAVRRACRTRDERSEARSGAGGIRDIRAIDGRFPAVARKMERVTRVGCALGDGRWAMVHVA
jgi:hypothetical protein